MKYNHNNTIISKCRAAMLACLLLVSILPALAQDAITQVHGIVSDEFGPLMGATVCEIDGTGRIINSAITDMNGNFTMKVKNQKDKIRFSFVGLKTQTLPINKQSFDIKMENATQLQEVVVKSKKRMQGNSLPIPEREISFATQSISTKEFEGLGINTIDEALQGRIAGLDIISNSGNLGAGSTMRLRGTSSMSSLTNANPLIVVDGNEQDLDLSSFDLASSNEESFAQLLNINTEDIASIQVLKDGSAAIYGSKGANGVIEIITKRGSKQKPQFTYVMNMTATYQPEGMKMLSGDDYTMLLKEAYFNPNQSDAASNINEINYDPTFSEYEQYNNNTDWRKAVTQWGLRQNHTVSITGGGDKAAFRISGSYAHETGTVIAQVLDRFTVRENLDYKVSDRIRVSTNFSMTYTKNNRNSDNLLDIAYKKMPNMSIYEQDPVTGENTDKYYNMLQSGPNIGSQVFEHDQRTYVNPVASAYLAKNVQSTFSLNPELILNYELLGLDEDHTRLNWKGQVYMNVNNEYTDRFYPSELVTTAWSSGHNPSSSYSAKSVSFTTKHTLTLFPAFTNKDHKLMAMGRFEVTTGNSNFQNTNGSGLPSGGIESPDAGGLITGLGSGFNEWRSMYFLGNVNYTYKERYVFFAAARADGTTKFGPDKRWGVFPTTSLKWIISDEPWMKSTEKWLSMLALRVGWGRTGNAPRADYLYTSKYAGTSQYIDMNAMQPINMRLTNLQWETTDEYNLGLDLNLLNDRLTLAFEVYQRTTTDQLSGGFRIPSNTGYASLAYKNDGKMRNSGWEFRVNTNKIIKAGKFSMDGYINFANNRNEILEMSESVLANLNSTFNNSNRQVLTRVQLNNPFGAIYGFRYKGVYQYQYETFKKMSAEDQAAFLAAGKTAPVALNKDGMPVVDDEGNPIRMMFAYTNDGTGRNYNFKGGDAIYEDINKDGQINALDIVYLGSSLPKLTGGFGFTFNYGDWRLSSMFNYRLGNKVLNMARLDAEAMVNNNNQSQAVNYRWRKEGDVTSIPRAMYGDTSNFNTLISDRFVEDGSFLRLNYLQLSYGLKKKALKGIGINGLRFYASANNLFCLTKYTGVDPEIGYGSYGAATDRGQTPRSRSYTFSMTVDF